MVASHEVKLLKPDPHIYELACRRLGVRPEDAAFVGDGGSNELAGAEEAGLTAFWASWFIERWPKGMRPNGFPDDDWRHGEITNEAPYPRLFRPQDLLSAIN